MKVRILLLGRCYVGKSSLCKVLTTGLTISSDYIHTKGIHTYTKTIQLKEMKLTIELIDNNVLPEQTREITEMLSRVDAVWLVYDENNISTRDYLEGYVDILKQQQENSHWSVVTVGNKIDKHKSVDKERVLEYENYVVSAKSKLNVNHLLMKCVCQLLGVGIEQSGVDLGGGILKTMIALEEEEDVKERGGCAVQ